MASIFLSYAREDSHQAQALAKCFERAGHSVWWDRHIHGGAEFSDEIETALRDADVIVVLWSAASVKSAWVRDEAAEGRDSGRLVPVQLDECAPPLGFRQLQAILVTGWSGRGNPPNKQALLAAVAARSGKAVEAPASKEPSRKPRRALVAGLAAVAALLALVGGWWLLADRSEASAPPVLAVLPFTDLSPEGDKAYFAEGVAEAILTVLAKDPGIKVLGRNSAQQLQAAGKDAAEMRQALGVTHVLEGSARSAGDQLRMSVRLINAADGRQVWAEEYARRLDNVFAVQDEIGRSVATKLRGSFGGGGAQPITKADIYALYLAARSRMRDRRDSSLTDALELARRVIAADTAYAPGHALYSELVWHLSEAGYGKIPVQQARTIAERHARQAIKLAPNSADGYAALGLVSTDAASINPLQKAIRLDPARAELRQWLGHSLAGLGRHEEALEQFRAAVEMDPLWNPGAMMLAYVLAASGRHDDAERAVAAFERRGGPVAVATKVRGDLAQYRGDYSEAVRLSQLAIKLDPETPQADLSAAWYAFMLGLEEQAASAAKSLPRNTRLAVGGKRAQLLDEARRAGADIWNQSDRYSALYELAAARDWHRIAALHDARHDIVQSLCDDSEQLGTILSLANALKAVGRPAESEPLLRCARTALQRHGHGPIRAPQLSAAALEVSWAELHAIEGKRDLAFAALNRAIDRGLRTSFGSGLSEFVAFDAFKTDPRYARFDSLLKRLIAKERAEYLAAERRAA